jgi:hypothetical protein
MVQPSNLRIVTETTVVPIIEAALDNHTYSYNDLSDKPTSNILILPEGDPLPTVTVPTLIVRY